MQVGYLHPRPIGNDVEVWANTRYRIERRLRTSMVLEQTALMAGFGLLGLAKT